MLADARAAAGVRIAKGAYSAGSSHGMASIPTAKKKLKRNSMTDAMIPHVVLPLDTVPARTAMQLIIPITANNISFRRPSLSRIQMGGRAEKKYATPVKPASRSERCCESPTLRWKMLGA